MTLLYNPETSIRGVQLFISPVVTVRDRRRILISKADLKFLSELLGWDLLFIDFLRNSVSR